MVEKSHTAGWLPNVYEPLRHIGQKVADWFAPPSDASASDQCYDIDVELPGVKTEDVDVTVHNNSLTVRGEKRSQRQESGRSFFFLERQFGAFQRTFRLPEDADANSIEAAFDDGVLHLKVGKKKATKPQEKKIKITRN